MSEEEKEAIEFLKKEIVDNPIIFRQWFEDMEWDEEERIRNSTDKVLKLLDKKDKVIEKTCKYINEAKIMNKAIPLYLDKKYSPDTVGVASTEEIKQYFYEQVEKVGGEDE